MSNDKKLQPTTDYGLTAWLIDFKHINDKRDEMKVIKRGKGIFYFERSDSEWFELKKEYDLSGFCDHAKRMARLRDLTF